MYDFISPRLFDFALWLLEVASEPDAISAILRFYKNYQGFKTGASQPAKSTVLPLREGGNYCCDTIPSIVLAVRRKGLIMTLPGVVPGLQGV